MGIKKVGGYRFVSSVSNHSPYHIHVFYGNKELGRFNIEAQSPLDKKLKMTRKLKRALREAGYLRNR